MRALQRGQWKVMVAGMAASGGWAMHEKTTGREQPNKYETE
jgi:hypothetical protein